MADVSFPPASAKSGLPPPEPPTSLASSWTIFPAWSLGIRSFVTPVITATLPSFGGAQNHDARAELLAQGIDHLAKAFAVRSATCAARNLHALDLAYCLQQVAELASLRPCASGRRAAFQGLDLVDLALDGSRDSSSRGVEQAAALRR